MAAFWPTLPVEPLSSSETSAILMMREEEKLARDVYLTLAAIYPQPIFNNIASSEQSHMNAVGFLIQRYGLVDPVTDNTVGVFQTPLFQEIYTSLIRVGGWSLNHALWVGNLIEDLDINDLDLAIAQSDSADVLTVFQNLQKGSRNHLRSFHSNLWNRGWTYYPYFLQPAPFLAILLTPHEVGIVDLNGVPI